VLSILSSAWICGVKQIEEITLCTVFAESLHLRECAGLHCLVIAWLSKGDVLVIQEKDHDWIKVTTPAGQVDCLYAPLPVRWILCKPPCRQRRSVASWWGGSKDECVMMKDN